MLSFLLAALAAVFKVYRPLVPVGERLRGMFRKEVREKQTRVELVDNGFEGRESVMREQGLGMVLGCGGEGRGERGEGRERRRRGANHGVAYPALAVVAEIR